MHLWSSEQTLYLHLLPELVETIGNLARFWIFWRYEAPLTYSFKIDWRFSSMRSACESATKITPSRPFKINLREAS